MSDSRSNQRPSIKDQRTPLIVDTRTPVARVGSVSTGGSVFPTSHPRRSRAILALRGSWVRSCLRPFARTIGSAGP